MADSTDIGVALAIQKTIWPMLHKYNVTVGPCILLHISSQPETPVLWSFVTETT